MFKEHEITKLQSVDNWKGNIDKWRPAVSALHSLPTPCEAKFVSIQDYSYLSQRCFARSNLAHNVVHLRDRHSLR